MATWHPRKSVVFLRTAERWGGLSNMAPDFALEVDGTRILTSEALYQASKFPHLPAVQRRIIAASSPMVAKRIARGHRRESRPDWDQVRVEVMRWCLRVKLAHNLRRFGDLLLSTGDRPIVERSEVNAFWAAKPWRRSVLVGDNQLGILLMELRELVRQAGAASATRLRTRVGHPLRHVDPPEVEGMLLLGRPIGAVTVRPQRPRTRPPPPPQGFSLEEHRRAVEAAQPRHVWNGDMKTMFLRRLTGPASPTAGDKARDQKRWRQRAKRAKRLAAMRSKGS